MSLVVVETRGPVRTVTLNRPEKRNALNAEMMTAIKAAFSDEPPAKERVTVLRAEGPAFCAGLQLSSDGLAAGAEDMAIDLFDTVQKYPLPVIARVNGPAVAGGCELALHCDFVVAAADAPFAMPVAQIGVATTWFLTKKIVETAGLPMAREILLIGDPVSAARLHELGLIHKAVAPSELDAATNALADRLAANAPLSLRAIKAQLLKQMSVVDTLDHAVEDALTDRVFATEDAREGVAAKFERRTPSFKGE